VSPPFQLTTRPLTPALGPVPACQQHPWLQSGCSPQPTASGPYVPARTAAWPRAALRRAARRLPAPRATAHRRPRPPLPPQRPHPVTPAPLPGWGLRSAPGPRWRAAERGPRRRRPRRPVAPAPPPRQPATRRRSPSARPAPAPGPHALPLPRLPADERPQHSVARPHVNQASRTTCLRTCLSARPSEPPQPLAPARARVHCGRARHPPAHPRPGRRRARRGPLPAAG
jgi:hypothetical protein